MVSVAIKQPHKIRLVNTAASYKPKQMNDSRRVIESKHPKHNQIALVV